MQKTKLEVKIEGNKIYSPLREKKLTLQPEEKIRQSYICKLVNDYLNRLQGKFYNCNQIPTMGNTDFHQICTRKKKHKITIFKKSIISILAPVAQLDRVTASEAVGHAFESHQAHSNIIST